MCPYCNNVAIVKKASIISNLNKKKYDLFVCPICLLEFFTPLVFEDVYENEKNESYKEFHKGRVVFPDWTKMMTRSLSKMDFKSLDSARILEIGPGDGINFIALRDAFNIQPDNYYAVELDNKSIEVCKRRGISNIVSSYFDENIVEKFNIPFDVILITEVLEHQVNPRGFLDTAFKLLSDKGFLIITVPNSNRAFIKFRSDNGDVPPHHFLRFSTAFFSRNFKKQVFLLKEYSFVNKTIRESSDALSSFLFRSPSLFFLMIPFALCLRIIDYIWGEGIIVFIRKK